MKKMYLLLKDSRASMTALTAFLLFIVVGLLAVVIDLGHLHAVKVEVANAADAGALGGARHLFPIDNYPDPTLIPAVDPPYCALGEQQGSDTACLNRSDKARLGDAGQCAATAERGYWDWDNNTWDARPGLCSLTDPATQINAIRVAVRRSASPQGSVIMGFAQFLGFQMIDVEATAIAAVGYVNQVPPGTAGGFIASYEDFLKDIQEGDYGEGPYWFVLNQTPDKGYDFPFDGSDNAAWSYAEGAGGDPYGEPIPSTPNPPKLTDVINDGTQVELSVGDEIGLNEGIQGASVFNPLKQQIAAHNGNWEVIIPTLDSSVETLNHPEPITNFWSVTLHEAYKAGDKLPDGTEVPPHVTLVQFSLNGPMNLTGGGSGPVPSNMYATRPKLVWTDSNLFGGN